MTLAPVTVVLDIGKTQVRVCAVDESGVVVATAAAPSMVRPGPPYPHLDVKGATSFVEQAVAGFARRFEIRTLIPAAHGATAALVDGDDLALPVLDYEFEGVSAADRRYEATPREYARTFSPRLPAGLNLGRQLAWLEETQGEAFTRSLRILPWPQYWAFWLSGEAVSEVTSLGCHTDLWHPSDASFSARGLRHASRFPALVPAWQDLGPVRGALQERLGLPASCRVRAGIHDSNAAYLRHRGARKGPFTLVSTGTWVVCMARGASLAKLDEAADMLANVDAFGAPVPCARFMGGREVEALCGTASPAPTFAGLAEIVACGAFAWPSFAPQGGAYRQRKGRVESVGPDGDRAALASAYAAVLTLDALDRLGAVGDVIVEGPFARNAVFAGILATGSPLRRVLVSDEPQGTALGAALLVHAPSGPYPQPRLEVVAPLDVRGLAPHLQRWQAGLGQGRATT